MAVMTTIKSARRFPAAWSALALSAALLALPGTALAQDYHRHDGNGGNGGGNGGRYDQPSARPAPPQPRPMPGGPSAWGQNGRGPGQPGGQYRPAPGYAGNGWQARQPQPNAGFGQDRGGYQGQPAYRGPPRGGSYSDGARIGGQWRNDGGPGQGDGNQWRGAPGYGRPGASGYGRGAQWDHGWRQDNRYDWRGWREQNRDVFHVGRYYPPYRDYSYDRLGVGFTLQPLFFGSDYWIDDPYYYHLPPAYGPYHWVRYYNDAILVDTYTGQVADVIYDFFW